MAISSYEILEIIRFGQLDLLKEMIATGKINLPYDLLKIENHGTACHVAAKFGQLKVLQYLLCDLKWEENGVEKNWGFSFEKDARNKNTGGKIWFGTKKFFQGFGNFLQGTFEGIYDESSTSIRTIIGRHQNQ